MKCLECGQAELIADVRDQSYTYKGQATIINHVRGEYCSACNEAVLRMDEVRRVMQLQAMFNNEVNASSGQPIIQDGLAR